MRYRHVTAPPGLSLFAAVKCHVDEKLNGKDDVLRGQSISNLRAKTSNQLRLDFGEEAHLCSLAQVVEDSPAGDGSLLQAMARRHSTVLSALAKVIGRTIWLLSFDLLPQETEGCADGAASGWAMQECRENFSRDAGTIRMDGKLNPHWVEFAAATSKIEGADSPLSGLGEVKVTGPDPKLASGGAVICLVKLFDHHFDLLEWSSSKDRSRDGNENAAETVSQCYQILISYWSCKFLAH